MAKKIHTANATNPKGKSYQSPNGYKARAGTTSTGKEYISKRQSNGTKYSEIGTQKGIIVKSAGRKTYISDRTGKMRSIKK